MDIEVIYRDIYEMKLKALDMSLSTKFGAHIGGGFSLMEIMRCIYEIANIPSMEDITRDRIILSKGHGVLALYTALWKKGFLTEDDLSSFETNGTQFHGHAHRNLKKGIEFSGGSLGLGLSYAVGVAKACQCRHINNRIFVIIGDGEMDEGIVWESLMSIANFQLNNITLIVDCNRYQLDGATSEVMNIFSIEEKLNSFGFDVETVDGHSVFELLKAIEKKSDKPRAVIANTVKAKGISFLENNKLSHQCVLTKKKYDIAIEEITKDYHGESSEL